MTKFVEDWTGKEVWYKTDTLTDKESWFEDTYPSRKPYCMHESYTKISY